MRISSSSSCLASADLQNGVLTVTIPKAQAARSRKIEIRGAGTTPAIGAHSA